MTTSDPLSVCGHGHARVCCDVCSYCDRETAILRKALGEIVADVGILSNEFIRSTAQAALKVTE